MELVRDDPMTQPRTCHPKICLRLKVGKVQGLGEGGTANLSLTDEQFLHIG